MMVRTLRDHVAAATGKAFALLLLALLALAAIGAPRPAAAEPLATPVVMELFTSQGCSSCPPADRILRIMCLRDDLIALSMHVDYWDYIGWEDRFATPENTARQRDYARRFGRRNVFTPQVVLNGVVQGVGSRKEEMEDLIAKARELAPPKVEVLLEAVSGQGVRAMIAPTVDQTFDRTAHVLLVTFDKEQEVAIGHGENAGKTLVYGHVVRSLERVGRWQGDPLELALPDTQSLPSASSGVAVIVQEPSGGPVIGAAMLRPSAD